MKPVAQEDGLGCAVACVAFVLSIPYSQAVDLFNDGRRRVKEEANFYCPEIVKILNNKTKQYKWKKLPENVSEDEIPEFSIMFVERSKKLPFGHFLCKYNNQWMNPWINLPSTPVNGGFQKALPGNPTHMVYPIESK